MATVELIAKICQAIIALGKEKDALQKGAAFPPICPESIENAGLNVFSVVDALDAIAKEYGVEDAKFRGALWDAGFFATAQEIRKREPLAWSNKLEEMV